MCTLYFENYFVRAIPENLISMECFFYTIVPLFVTTFELVVNQFTSYLQKILMAAKM